MNRRSLFYGILSCCLLGVCGCGEPGAPSGTVSGKVTFNGTPIEEGIVNFFSKTTNTGGTGEIGSGGVYEAPTATNGLPVGDYDVYITPPMITLPDTADSPGGEGFKEVNNIPQKYRTSTNSGLKVTINEGPNSFDIEMTDDGKAK